MSSMHKIVSRLLSIQPNRDLRWSFLYTFSIVLFISFLTSWSVAATGISQTCYMLCMFRLFIVPAVLQHIAFADSHKKLR